MQRIVSIPSTGLYSPYPLSTFSPYIGVEMILCILCTGFMPCALPKSIDSPIGPRHCEGRGH
jgi:hypothetical protein